MVSFRAGGQDFCIEVLSVREIRGWTPATMLPHAPVHLVGVINLRGSVVPIVDLACRLGIGVADPSPRHVTIIVMANDQTVGLLVESVSDILSLPAEAIQPAPAIASDEVRAWVSGVIAAQDRLIRLIDLTAILPAPPSDAA